MDTAVTWTQGRALSFLNKLALALLAVAAITLAWALGIRQRRALALLTVERTQRAHLEELSFAAAGLAHETKNPLGLIRGFAQRIEDTPRADPETLRLASQIIDAADRAAERLGEFLHFARLRDPHLQPTPARALLDDLAQILRVDADAAQVRLDLHAEDLTLLADPDMLRQVLLNLVLNSLEASPPHTTLTLRVTAEGRAARLEVIDQGRGIAPHLLPDVFKPYVTDSPRGHGLGLAIVRRIVERHGWTITLQSEPQHGTRVTLYPITTL
jgi:signal transduction histidine kinase